MVAAVVSSVDTADPLAVVTAQLDDMQQGSTKVAYQLASPGNRAGTAAPTGYNFEVFDRMLRNHTYAPLVKGFGYEVGAHGSREPSSHTARVRIFLNGAKTQSVDYEFEMSIQASNVVDEDPSLGEYVLQEGHSPVWRTDRVMPVPPMPTENGVHESIEV